MSAKVIMTGSYPNVTTAEHILQLAKDVTMAKDCVMVVDPAECVCPDFETTIGRIKLAIALSKRPKGFQLQAIWEDWDIWRIVREMY